MIHCTAHKSGEHDKGKKEIPKLLKRQCNILLDDNLAGLVHERTPRMHSSLLISILIFSSAKAYVTSFFLSNLSSKPDVSASEVGCEFFFLEGATRSYSLVALGSEVLVHCRKQILTIIITCLGCTMANLKGRTWALFR